MRDFKDVMGIKNDLLLKLIVGGPEDNEVFHIQESLFTGISDVFTAMIQHKDLGEEERGTYKFPDDSVRAWKMLLYWKVEGGLPEILEGRDCDTEELLWVECWILGDKYNIKQFQDEVMLELLSVLEQISITPECASLAANSTPPESNLRLLMCNEIIHTVYNVHNLGIETFDKALAAIGFAAEVLDALNQYHKSGRVIKVHYVGDRDGHGRADQWQQYMVDGGPCRHWVHNGKVEVECQEGEEEDEDEF